MNKLLIEDVLSWDKFLNETLKEDTHPPKKIKLFNRIMAHSNNFFSGVYYAQSDRGTSIIFSDPRQQSQVLLPSKKHNFDKDSMH